jgi:hypothetical protein
MTIDNTAFVMFPPDYLQRDAWFSSSKPQLIAAYQDGRYEKKAAVKVGARVGEAAAEECFDLTNHPGRQQEREQKYGRLRSVSCGDIVVIGGDAWLCASVGWEKI